MLELVATQKKKKKKQSVSKDIAKHSLVREL